jgi:hypothetical protein
MANRLRCHAHELLAIDKVKKCKAKRNSIIEEGGPDLVHCICDCVYNVLNGNIPISEQDKKRLSRHKDTLRELVKKKTSNKERKRLVQSGGFLGALIPTIVSLIGGLFGRNG